MYKIKAKFKKPFTKKEIFCCGKFVKKRLVHDIETNSHSLFIWCEKCKMKACFKDIEYHVNSE